MPILNVDDNAPSRFLRSRILENAGFEVREADSAEQALAYTLTERPPDLVAPKRDAAITPPATVITDDSGYIISANAAVTRLLNLSARGLTDRSILTFFAPGRDRIAAALPRAVAGRVVQETATMRPRDRKPFNVRVDISSVPFERGGSLEWVLEPIPDS